MINQRALIVCLASLMAGIIACNMPSPSPYPTDEAVAATNTQSAAPTDELTLQPGPSTTEPEDITGQLEVALVSENYETLETLMGDAFLIEFEAGERGLITVDDAITLLRTDLLSGTDPIAFDPSVDPAGILGTAIEIQEILLTTTRFSTGWGAQNRDQAIILIGQNPEGDEFFAGLIYARQGFTSTSPTPTADTTASSTPMSAPDPAPRGAIRYETSFLQGWPTFNDDHVTSQHTAEGYLLSVVDMWGGWAFTSQVNVTAYYAEIEVTPQDCPQAQGSYGLIFNHADSDEFLVFVIECNGTYTLWERTPTARSETLLTGDLPEGLDALTGEHRLGVLTQGSDLVLYIDDLRIGAVSHSTNSGDFGPYVETSGSSTMSALFTNLSIFDTE